MKPSQEQIDAIEEKAAVDESVVRAAMSRVPPSWQALKPFGHGGAFKRGSLQVLFTVCRYDDGRIWTHASVSGRTPSGGFYLPDYEDIKRVKQDFFGDRWAYQVFPSEKHYINQNPYVLHLYGLMDGAPALPDFTWGLGTI